MNATKGIGFRLALLAVVCLSVASAAASDGDGAPQRQPYIDEILSARWEAAKVKASPLATDAEFLRRAYLDLVGRIPNLQEAAAFLESREPNKRAKLVDYLLEHPDYAKNMANTWTMLLVGRRPQGNRVDSEALASWLRKQFGENRPWNEVAHDLIAAQGSNKDNGAANYVLAHKQDGAVNLTSITTRVFLGQQIQCTQCHDHKSNDWKQDHFWGINAFFKGVRSREITRADQNGTEAYAYTEVYDEPSEAYASFDRSNGTVGVAFPMFLDGTKISRGTDVDRRRALADAITSADQKQFARAYVNRAWSLLMGRGIVHPVDDFGDHNPPAVPELIDKLAVDFKSSGYDTKALFRWIANSRVYQLSSKVNKDNEKDETLYSHKMARPMSPEQLFDALITATAAHRTGGANMDRVRRDWLNQFTVAFANDEETESNAFQGTIPQALMLMNGDLMARATDGSPGSFLAETLQNSQGSRAPAEYIVNRLYLAALSRPPSTQELRRMSAYFQSSTDPRGVIEDLFWSLLNSSEFILNH
jgi:hypothetical protein